MLRPVQNPKNFQASTRTTAMNDPGCGTLGYGPPGLHPGFQGFGLGYHLGYGYGGKRAAGSGCRGGLSAPRRPRISPPLAEAPARRRNRSLLRLRRAGLSHARTSELFRRSRPPRPRPAGRDVRERPFWPSSRGRLRLVSRDGLAENRLFLDPYTTMAGETAGQRGEDLDAVHGPASPLHVRGPLPGVGLRTIRESRPGRRSEDQHRRPRRSRWKRPMLHVNDVIRSINGYYTQLGRPVLDPRECREQGSARMIRANHGRWRRARVDHPASLTGSR